MCVRSIITRGRDTVPAQLTQGPSCTCGPTCHHTHTSQPATKLLRTRARGPRKPGAPPAKDCRRAAVFGCTMTRELRAKQPAAQAGAASFLGRGKERRTEASETQTGNTKGPR